MENTFNYIENSLYNITNSTIKYTIKEYETIKTNIVSSEKYKELQKMKKEMTKKKDNNILPVTYNTLSPLTEIVIM